MTALVKHNTSHFAAFADSVSPPARIIGKILKFHKDWGWTAAGDPMSEGVELVALMGTLVTGFEKWGGQKLLASRMRRVAEGIVPLIREDLGDLDEARWERDRAGKPKDPWQKTHRLTLVTPDKTHAFTFATTSDGGAKALGDLSREWDREMGKRPGTLPLVALEADSYEHKAYGRVKIPVFSVIRYVDAAPFESASRSEPKALAPPFARDDDDDYAPDDSHNDHDGDPEDSCRFERAPRRRRPTGGAEHHQSRR
jgi:hypothetical protein